MGFVRGKKAVRLQEPGELADIVRTEDIRLGGGHYAGTFLVPLAADDFSDFDKGISFQGRYADGFVQLFLGKQLVHHLAVFPDFRLGLYPVSCPVNGGFQVFLLQRTEQVPDGAVQNSLQGMIGRVRYKDEFSADPQGCIPDFKYIRTGHRRIDKGQVGMVAVDQVPGAFRGLGGSDDLKKRTAGFDFCSEQIQFYGIAFKEDSCDHDWGDKRVKVNG